MFIAADGPTSRLLSLLSVGDGCSLVILVWHVSANIEFGWFMVMNYEVASFLKQHESRNYLVILKASCKLSVLSFQHEN